MFVVNRIKDEVEETFDRFDQDGDGRVSFQEFAGVMLEIDHDEARQALRIIFDAIDQDADGCVSFAEFHQWISR